MDILMPKVGLTMTEGTIVQWHKNVGDAVRRGDILFTFETEKSTLEFESPTEGVLTRILAPAGQLVACLVPVAQIDSPSVPAQSLAASSASAVRQPGAATQTPRPISPRARLRAREFNLDLDDVTGSGPDGVVLERDVMALEKQRSQVTVAATPSPDAAAWKITPLAGRVAAELGVDLTGVKGSGPDGTITREDVERAAAAKIAVEPPSVQPEIQPLTPARRITAQRTAESIRTAAHVTLTTEADATALVSAREQLNAELNDKVSYNALLIAIVARALSEHPQLNASWADTGAIGTSGVVLHPDIHIGVAVDTPRGLYVPVVKHALRPLIEIHRDLNDLVARTMAGNVTGDDFAGGTFTITNLGMFEIDTFTPIIHQPQAAILGVGRIQAKPVARGEQVVIRQMMALSLSFDHRVVDGAPAAKFLQRVKALVERPFALLV